MLTDPEAEVSTDLLDVSYAFDRPAPSFGTPSAPPSSISTIGRQNDMPLDFVAQLSQVDGAVHLTSDLVLRGFGAKIKSNADVKLMTRDIGNQDARPMLPRSPARATDRPRCSARSSQDKPSRSSSQDGDVTLFGRRGDGSVLKIGPFALGAGLAVGA